MTRRNFEPMKRNAHTNNKNKPKKQINCIDFSYWCYKFNLLPIIGTMLCKVHPIILNIPHHIKQGLY